MDMQRYTRLRKIATDYGAPELLQVMDRERDLVHKSSLNPDKYDKGRIPDSRYSPGSDIPVADTVAEVLDGNYRNLKHWADSPYAKQFKLYAPYAEHIWGARQFLSGLPIISASPLVHNLPNLYNDYNKLTAPRRVVNNTPMPGPLKRQSDWMCLQGLSYCSPGDPLRLSNGKYVTTTDLNKALNSKTAVPINPNFSLYVLDDGLAHSLDYSLPGSFHLAEYPEGNGHAVMNAGGGRVFEFHEPGLEEHPMYAPDIDMLGKLNHTPWVRRAEHKSWGSRYPEYFYRADGTPAFKNVRMMVPLPNKITPDKAVEQFYSLFASRPELKGSDILTLDEYRKAFGEANAARAQGAHYVIPSIMRNPRPVAGQSRVNLQKLIDARNNNLSQYPMYLPGSYYDGPVFPSHGVLR